MAFPSVIDWSNTVSESHIYYLFSVIVSLLDTFSGHENQKIPCPVWKVQRDRLAVPVLREGEAELSNVLHPNHVMTLFHPHPSKQALLRISL